MPNKQEIYRWIDDNGDQVVGLLQKLIRAPSVNPAFSEEKRFMHEDEAQAVVRDFLERELGASAEYQYPDAQKLAAYKDKPGYYADHVFANRPNVYGVCRGTGGGRSIMLSGHIDVVQRGTKWTHDPFAADCVDGRIYGRGAVDMKGGIASMLMAVKAIQACGLRLAGDVKFGTVVDEEAGGMGTLALMAAGYRADACMISEPTDLQIAPLCRGILWGRIVIPGRAGHIEMPQPDWRTGSAVDAIEKGRIYLHAIRNLNQDWAVHKEHKYMKIPCQINIAEVHAGNYPTTYAERCEIVFDAQYLPAEKDENGLGSRVKKELEDFVAAVAQTDGWLRENPPHIEWIVDADCGETLDDQPFFTSVVQSTREVNPASEVEGIGFHTDMGWFCNVGIPTMNIGPGNPRLAHHSDEFVPVKDLLTCTKIMASIVADWCGLEGGEPKDGE